MKKTLQVIALLLAALVTGCGGDSEDSEISELRESELGQDIQGEYEEYEESQQEEDKVSFELYDEGQDYIHEYEVDGEVRELHIDRSHINFKTNLQYWSSLRIRRSNTAEQARALTRVADIGTTQFFYETVKEKGLEEELMNTKIYELAYELKNKVNEEVQLPYTQETINALANQYEEFEEYRIETIEDLATATNVTLEEMQYIFHQEAIEEAYLALHIDELDDQEYVEEFERRTKDWSLNDKLGGLEGTRRGGKSIPYKTNTRVGLDF